MNPDEIAKIISQEVDSRIARFVDNQYLRGFVTAVSSDRQKATVKIEGSLAETPNIPCVNGYYPTVGDKVLVLNIGRSGANLLIINRLDGDTDWHIVDGTGEPAYENGWVDYNTQPGTYAGGGFMKDENGYIHLRGLIKNGTDGTTVFTLPVGYRPLQKNIFTIESDDLAGRLDVDDTGEVIPASSTTSPAWISLDGIVFLGEK